MNILNAKKIILSCISLTLAASAIQTTEASPSNQSKAVARYFRQPDTPFLPPYSGRIVHGSVDSSSPAEGGIAYTITFETAEQPLQVLNWYKTAFQQNGWNLEANGTSYRLSGQHGKNVATSISLMSPTKAGASAQVQVYYRYAGQDI